MFFINKELKYRKLSKKYDEEIRETCDEFKKSLEDCMKRLEKIEECKYNHNKFLQCIKRFDENFRFKYNLD